MGKISAVHAQQCLALAGLQWGVAPRVQWVLTDTGALGAGARVLGAAPRGPPSWPGQGPCFGRVQCGLVPAAKAPPRRQGPPPYIQLFYRESYDLSWSQNAQCLAFFVLIRSWT